MDNNIPKIELSELHATPAYYLAKKCLDCVDSQGKTQVRVLEDMQLPTLEAAIAIIKGFTDVAVQQNPGAKYENGILYITDNEGEAHRYIQAVITGNPTVAWQSSEAENTDARFKDIVSALEFDNPTE